KKIWELGGVSLQGNREVIAALEEAKQSGKQAVIATVVGVRGSAYRREGAKMVIDEVGNTFGLISGGCLEPDVAETAKQVMETGTPLLREYDMDEETV